MADVWFYARNGQQDGPVSLERLREMVEQGELGQADSVWTEGMTAWVPVNTVDELVPTAGEIAADAEESAAEDTGPDTTGESPAVSAGRLKRYPPSHPAVVLPTFLSVVVLLLVVAALAAFSVTTSEGLNWAFWRPTASGPLLTASGPVSGHLPPRGRGKVYRVEMEAGKTYAIEADGGSFLPVLVLRDEVGRPVHYSNQNVARGFGVVAAATELIYTPASGGTYTVEVQSGDGRWGNFDLRLRALRPLVASSDSLAPAERRAVPVPMKAGREYILSLESTDFDAYLELNDPRGVQIASDDDGGQGLNSRLVFSPPADGQYTVIIRALGANPGRFQFRVEEGAAGKTGVGVMPGPGGVPGGFPAVSPSAPVTGTNVGTFAGNLPVGGSQDYKVELEAGATYHLHMKSNEFDTYLYLYDAGGAQVASNDDSGGGPRGTDSWVIYRTPAAGTYRLEARSFGNSSGGAYTILVQKQ